MGRRVVCLLFFWFVCDVFCEDLRMVARLPKHPLMKYTSYSSVMILHFDMPVDTEKAVFMFKAKDTPSSVFVRSCDARNVSVYLRHGAYPVINPDGVPFPVTFLNSSRPELHNLTLKTDLKPKYMNISAPAPGNWFAAAFISWTDPKNDRIEQQGLSAECDANLYTELYVTQKPSIQILPTLTVVNVTLHQNKPLIYKFYVPEDIDHILIALSTLNTCPLCGEIVASVQENRIPTQEENLDNKTFSGKVNASNYMQFWPMENKWHYLDLWFNDTEENSVEISIYLKFLTGIITKKANNDSELYFKSSVDKKLTTRNKALQNVLAYKQYNMMRISAADNFMFEYDLPPYKNGSSPMVLNITNTGMTVLKFKIYDVIDIGGTLSLGLAIKPDINMSKVESPNITIVACAKKDIKQVPTFPDQCVYNEISTPAPIILNSTIAGSLHLVHIPFPETGTWFITLRAFYDGCLTCKCSEVCQREFVMCTQDCENSCMDHCDECLEGCRKKVVTAEDCSTCDCDGACFRKKEEPSRNISMIFSISSHPCIAGRCGKYGKCNHYIAGGFIYSSCQCFGGYRGWDCSDGSQARAQGEILLSILLLTLSNLLFILSVYFAYRRFYYTEAVVYFFTMFFSTFYHACDAEESIYGFCLVRLGVLQFCDFYCGLMSIWVTLVAMTNFGTRITSISHICGAVLLAFGTIYNKQALWVFLMPAISGLVLIGISWGLKCHSTKKLFPAKTYLIRFMPIGLFLVLMGLISFAFLQTKDNYKFVHSFWHVIMAVSVIFLLPTQNNFIPKS